MARRTPSEGYDGSSCLEDSKQELFCTIFTTNTLPHYWGNAQNSYEFSYGHTDRIEKIEDEIEALHELTVAPKKKRKGKSLAGIDREIKQKHREISNIRRACRASSSRLLTNANIKKRNEWLLNQLSKDVIVDGELSYLIQQRDNFHVKMSAIEHYNKKEMRIRERLDIKHHFDPVKSIRMHTAKKPA